MAGASRYLQLAERLVAILFLASLLAALMAHLVLGDGAAGASGCSFSGRGVVVLETECRGFPGAEAIAPLANLWLLPLAAIFIGFGAMQISWAAIGLVGLLAMVLVGRGTIGLCGDIVWLLRRGSAT